MFCCRAVPFLFFCNNLLFVCVWNIFVCTLGKKLCQLCFPTTCELVSRVELLSSLSRIFDCPLNWVFNPAQPQIGIESINWADSFASSMYSSHHDKIESLAELLGDDSRDSSKQKLEKPSTYCN